MDQQIREVLENVKVTLTKYSKVGNYEVAKTNITPFRTSCIDNPPSTPPDFFYGVDVSGVTDVLRLIEKLSTENEEMKNKIIKLQTK